MRRKSVFMALFLSTSSTIAAAEWSSKIEDVGFGEKSASALAVSSDLGFAFGCERNSEPVYLRVITSEKATSEVRGISVKIEVSVDGAALKAFAAEIGVSRRETILVSSDLDEDEAREVANFLGSAKKSIAFRVALPNGKRFFSSTVSATGSRKAIERVVDTCRVAPKGGSNSDVVQSTIGNSGKAAPTMDNTLLSKWWDDRLRNARLVDIERHLNAAGRPAGGRRVEAMDVCLTKEYVEAKDKPTLNSAIERCDKRLP